MKKLYISSLLMLIFITGDTYAPERSPVAESVKFWVGVSVSCDDESLQSLIESHIKRELRALHDVDVGDSVGAYMIRVTAIENQRVSGEKIGSLSIATMFIQVYPFKNLAPYLSNESVFYRDVVNGEIPLLYYEPKLSVASYSKENTAGFCQQIVATFDIEILEPQRRKR